MRPKTIEISHDEVINEINRISRIDTVDIEKLCHYVVQSGRIKFERDVYKRFYDIIKIRFGVLAYLLSEDEMKEVVNLLNQLERGSNEKDT